MVRQLQRYTKTRWKAQKLQYMANGHQNSMQKHNCLNVLEKDAHTNGQTCFTEAMGKYNVTNIKTPIYITEMSASSFVNDLVGVRHLATKLDVVFTKDSCYLRGPTTTPLFAQIIGTRGTDNLHRTHTNLDENVKPLTTVDRT